jgi:mycothiol synthase
MHHVEIVSRLEDAHLEQLPGLLRAATLADGHEPLGEHKFLRLKHGHDLSRAVLAYESGDLLGYAHTVTFGEGDDRRVSCEFVVHPSQRRRGIGRLLLSHAIMNANDNAARRMDVWAYNDSPASSAIARQFGFEPVRRLLHLHRHMRGTMAERHVDGVSLRAFDAARDESAWLEANARAFASHPEQGHWSLDDLRARTTQPWFDAGDFLLAESDGRIVGFNWLKIEERPNEGVVGEIYVIGVDPEHQGRGIGAMLLAGGLRRMREREVDVAAIYVDETNSAAVALYESMGFHHHHVDVCYSRPLVARESTDDAAAAA